MLGIFALPARAYRAEEPVPLGKLDVQSSLIVKATALGSEPIRDALTGAPLKLKGTPYALSQTRFQIISVLKGQLAPGDELKFRHYSFDSAFDNIWIYSVRSYNFQAGRTYLLWASREGDNWQPFSPYDSNFHDQGALLAPDNAPVEGEIRAVVWSQIQGLLASPRNGDVKIGLRYLTLMRRRDANSYETTGDYPSDQVAQTLRPLLSSSDSSVATTAMRVAKFDAPRFAAELLANANSPDANVRAAALSALSLVATPASEARVRAAVLDRAPDVAGVALGSLGAFPGAATRATWKRWAGSDEPARRIGVARGIARARDAELLPILQTLTRDADKQVRAAAKSALWMYYEPNRRIIEEF